MASTLCLSLHWHELLTQSVAAVPVGLQRLKWPFVAIVVVLFISEFVQAGLRSADIDQWAAVLFSAINYLFVSLATSTFFISTAIRVILFLWRGNSKGAMGTAHERRNAIVRKARRPKKKKKKQKKKTKQNKQTKAKFSLFPSASYNFFLLNSPVFRRPWLPLQSAVFLSFASPWW